MICSRILVAGIGNIFFGDDAFGVAVAQRLAVRPLPEGVRAADFGIRGFDLAYALLDGYDATIMVDATPRGGTPGTLYVVEPEWDAVESAGTCAIDTHGMTPMKVLQLVKALGGPDSVKTGRLLVVGCEPATLGDDEGTMGLSAPVQQAVDEAVRVIEALVEDLRAGTGAHAQPGTGSAERHPTKGEQSL